MGLLSRSPKPSARPPELRPPRSMWWWVLPAALLIGAATWGTTEWLLQDLDRLPLAEQTSARIEAARTALAAAAGVGAAVTLMLAVRRQRHQELATAHTTHDAAERRVTELYTKAAEQLGNSQAPVRLAGLYALERLAQDTPELRQTIVDVICSYLRMPYTPARGSKREDPRCAAGRSRQRPGPLGPEQRARSAGGTPGPPDGSAHPDRPSPLRGLSGPTPPMASTPPRPQPPLLAAHPPRPCRCCPHRLRLQHLPRGQY
jgi:hypothetical protein